MDFTSKDRWIWASALVLGSPIFAIPLLFLTAVIASGVPAPESLDLWLNQDPFTRAIGLAVFTAMLSVESVLRSYYISLPLLLTGAYALLGLSANIYNKIWRTLASMLGVGLLYLVLLYVGVYFGWLQEIF